MSVCPSSSLGSLRGRYPQNPFHQVFLSSSRLISTQYLQLPPPQLKSTPNHLPPSHWRPPSPYAPFNSPNPHFPSTRSNKLPLEPRPFPSKVHLQLLSVHLDLRLPSLSHPPPRHTPRLHLAHDPISPFTHVTTLSSTILSRPKCLSNTSSIPSLSLPLRRITSSFQNLTAPPNRLRFPSRRYTRHIPRADRMP